MKRHRSALKRARQEEKRRRYNSSYRSRIKTFTKRLNEELKRDDKEKVVETFRELTSAIDKAVQKGVIHKNTAGRKKSRIGRRVYAFLKGVQLSASQGVQESMGGISSPVI